MSAQHRVASRFWPKGAAFGRPSWTYPVRSGSDGVLKSFAVLLKNPQEHIGKTIPLSGPVEMDHKQMAEELSEALGRKIVFQDLPIDEYCTSIEAMGVPPYFVQHLRGAMADYQTGHMSGADNNVEK
jgi:NAD(P)H dehydrogenase (quinone)